MTDHDPRRDALDLEDYRNQYLRVPWQDPGLWQNSVEIARVCDVMPCMATTLYHHGNRWLCSDHLAKSMSFVVGETPSNRKVRLE